MIINMGIEFVTWDHRDYFRIMIEDDGPGISDDLKETLFSRFKRGRPRRAEKAWASTLPGHWYKVSRVSYGSKTGFMEIIARARGLWSYFPLPESDARENYRVQA